MKINKLPPPSSETEIMQSWIYTDIVYVSIICCTFNQDKYISDAIDSFLSQKTTYKFEIIIHDDCSTDTTEQILSSYKSKFKNIIKIIRPAKNIYSEYGANYPGLNAISFSSGKYISLCEGDDYWIDENKIQKQVLALEKNNRIKICFTAAIKSSENDNSVIAFHNKKAKIFSVEDVIINGGAFMPTASLFINKDVFNNIPNWFKSAPIGDYYLQILSSIDNGAIYLPIVSSVYRKLSIGSWSESNLSHDRIISHREKSNNMYKFLLKEYPKYKKSFFISFIRSNLISILVSIKHLDFKLFLLLMKYYIKL
ncbi:glycosyltransferase [Proteus alimentorum]|uniref:glycosyltransferase n=1 Tax=Proteus alimentorum TaxID=1973495 RepID=UPI000BFFEE5F|nr:glycosyltransferase [Proteus alimentorum]